MLNNFAVFDSTTNFDVQNSFNYAFNFCEHKLKENRNSIISLFKKGNSSVHSDFRYALAKKIGAYLGDLSTNLSEIYLHGSAVKNRSGPGSDIDMIILLEYKFEPFKLLLFKLNDEIEFFYNEIMKHKYFTGEFSSLLDINLINSSEFESRKGFGAVINSVNSAPIKLWQCNPPGQEIYLGVKGTL